MPARRRTLCRRFAVLLALPPALLGCGAGSPGGGGDGVRVVVAVPPQAYVVDRLGGERVHTTVLVPPGSEPHSFEPLPRQLRAVAEARLYVRVGHPAFVFERRFLDRMVEDGTDLAVVDMSAGVELLALPDGGGGPLESDPHVWVAPSVVRGAAVRIAAALGRIDRAHGAEYERRLGSFLAEVEAVDRQLRRATTGARGRRFYVDHPAWGYLAREYGLEQVAIERRGEEPSARQLVALIEAARRDGVRLLFVQRGLAQRSGRLIADEIGAAVVEVDPLAYDWSAALRDMARWLPEALAG